MAMKPTASAAPAAPMSDDDSAAGADDTGADDAGADDSSDAAGSENVLLTVCKESDGTYSLIKGDEEDADGADAAGSADTAGTNEASGKQNFESIGALLKAILDILQTDASSDSGDGSSAGGDQFQAGFDENSPAKPASPMPQKY